MTADKPDTAITDITEDIAELIDRLVKLDKEIIDAIEELKAMEREKWSIDQIKQWGVANVPTMVVYIHGDEDEIQEEQSICA